MQPLDRTYFARPTLQVARDLVGALLVRELDPGSQPGQAPERLVGRIVETEAYTGDDPAMHGWKATFGGDGFVRPEGRAADLFAAPGTAYVYRIYYTNWLLNVVTEPEGTAGAVLIRALEPIEGIERMRTHRPPSIRRERDLTNGPGKLTQALGIDDASFHGTDLTTPPLYFADDEALPSEVATSARIGITRGVERPWRFFVPGSSFVSPGVPSDERIRRKQAKERAKRRGER
jgi:DNA-3-methyladenine glycosylase